LNFLGFIMKLLVLIFAFSFILINAKPQFDSDLYREKWSKKKIQNPIFKKELKLFMGETIFVDFSKQNLLDEIPVTSHTNSSMTLNNNDLTIKIEIDTFIAINHKLKYSKTDNNVLIMIDGRIFWGTDGGIPRKIIKSVMCQIGNKKIAIPFKDFCDLYEPNIMSHPNYYKKMEYHCKVYLSKDKKRIYIYMMNGDGAGSYEVTWIIQNKKYKRRVIDQNC